MALIDDLLGSLKEDAWGGKPGTNWKQVTPENRKKVNPLVKHYAKKAHPFSACVRDNTKRFGVERAKRICAVVKDMGRGTTKWRKGASKVKEAAETLHGVDAALGEGAAGYYASAALTGEETHDRLAETCFDAMGTLFLFGLVEQEDAAGLREEDYKFDAAAMLERVRAMEVPSVIPPRSVRPVVRRSEVLLPPDDPALDATGPTIEDDRSPHQKRAAKKRQNYAQAKAAGKYKGSSEKGGEFAGSKPGGGFIKVGASGDSVREVQAKVGAKQDGAFGKKTESAVRAFQKKNGLQVDGVVGRQTLAAMQGKKGAKRLRPGAITKKRLREEVLLAVLREERAVLEDFPARVRSMRLGEVVRMPDGITVARVSTLDGRERFRVSGPEAYRDPIRVDGYGPEYATAEEAIQAAYLRSARGTAPESVGGPVSLGYGVTLNGERVDLVGVDPGSLNPLVRPYDNLGAATRTVSWDVLQGRPRRVLRESAQEVADSSVPFPSR